MPVEPLMSRRRCLAGAAASMVAGPGRAEGGGRFPSRTITLLVPFAPGGIADLTARAVAEHMARTLGQPVVVDNQPSAGSIVASQAVAGAPPDGHTLLLLSNANAVSVSLLKLPYDPVKDFAPVSTLGSFDIGCSCRGNSRFATLKDALDRPRRPPGQAEHRHHRAWAAPSTWRPSCSRPWPASTRWWCPTRDRRRC
jgi:tripartite-type tricarboxylate transporter receptor subunit TctC